MATDSIVLLIWFGLPCAYSNLIVFSSNESKSHEKIDTLDRNVCPGVGSLILKNI